MSQIPRSQPAIGIAALHAALQQGAAELRPLDHGHNPLFAHRPLARQVPVARAHRQEAPDPFRWGVGILRGLHRGGGSARRPAQPTLALIFEQTQLAKIVPKVHYVDD